MNRHARWYTWAPEFRSLAVELSEAVGGGSLDVHEVSPGERYTATFTPPPRYYELFGLQERMLAFAAGLIRLPTPRGLVLVRDMTVDIADERGLGVVFACLRDALAALTRRELGALYAPLGETGPAAGDFPVHCDLYPAELLFNVFDDVAASEGGASLFISVSDFLRLAWTTPGVPSSVRRRAGRLLGGDFEGDCFAEAYELIYGSEDKWVADLREAVEREQLRIVFAPGEGYLLHDRTWMHGREAPSDGVSPRRLHRLVFQNTAALGRTPEPAAR